MRWDRAGRGIRRLCVAVALSVLVLTGCADSPEQQAEREDRAAAVATFELHMPEKVWESTNLRMGGAEVDQPASRTPEPDGMLRLELTGEQMVDYLAALDHNAHGGIGATEPELSAAVYDAVVAVIDTLPAAGTPGAPAPRIDIPAWLTPSGATPTS